MNLATELDRLSAPLRSTLRDGGLIETAQVGLLGLDVVRKKAGARWPRMRDHVHEGSLRIINRQIGPEDCVIACGDGFLVIFAEGSSEEIERRCADIRDALTIFYLGEDALRQLRAETRREAVSADGLAGLVAEPQPCAKASDAPLPHGRFWPVWSAKRQAVAAYLCAPAIESEHTRRLGYDKDFLETGHHGDGDFLDIDLRLMDEACFAAEREGGAAIGVSVHATTLQKRGSRATYLRCLSAKTPAVRQRMFVKVAEIERGTPLLCLTEWTTMLRSAFPRVSLELHHSDRALGSIGSTGAWASGYHLPLSDLACGSPARSALHELDSRCRGLFAQGLQPFVDGFQEAGCLDITSYHTLAFATGETLWPSRDAPAALPQVHLRRTG